jgi:hypothetical protein
LALLSVKITVKMKRLNNNWWVHQKTRGAENVIYKDNIEERSRKGIEQFLFPGLTDIENDFQNLYIIKCNKYTLNNIQYLH